MGDDLHDISIYSPGEPNVGINPTSYTLPKFFLPDFDDEERERVRSIIATAFGEIWSAGVTVSFDDECPDCGHVLPCERHHYDGEEHYLPEDGLPADHDPWGSEPG